MLEIGVHFERRIRREEKRIGENSLRRSVEAFVSLESCELC